MQQQNTVRKQDQSPARGGLCLVHSRDWTPERQAREAAQWIQRQDRIASRERRIAATPRQNASNLKLSLIAATLCAAVVWAGHALLQWKHIR